MNNPFMRWLLDLEVIPAGAEGVRLIWEHDLAAWVWLILLLAAAAVAAAGYARQLGPRRGRAALAVVRFLIVAIVCVMISGPALELARETLEQDWVVVMVDRSASLQIADAPTPSGRQERDEQLASLLRDNADMWRELAETRHVLWLGFHDGAFDLPPAPVPQDAATQVAPVLLDEPAGRQTRINAALEQALQRAAARALSGVVVISDGRTTDPPTRSVIRRLRNDHVSVYAVPLGSPDPVGDMAIRRVDAPHRAFVRDEVPIVVELDQLGSHAGRMSATVRLIDETTGEELDRVDIDEAGEVTMTARPNLAGESTWRVVVETREPDLIAENNVKTIVIDLVDRPLRLLFVDGYPRWEYRYLKNLLIREKSIDSSVMLISADRDFAQEGNLPITRLPRSPEEFAPFDVLIIGDVPGTFFSPEQLEMMRDHVAERGAGLLWIGGERYTPRTYAGTPLADLLPMRPPLGLAAIPAPVNLMPTPLARRLGLLRLLGQDRGGWPPALTDPATGWSLLFWAQHIEPGRLKPAAEVLAETVQEFRGVHLPLVVQMRYGAGQVIYVATDEIWRWRYGQGEVLPERFWVQLLRRLGRESLAASQDVARMEVSPRRLVSGQAMRIELDLLDARLAAESRVAVTAVVERADGEVVAELELRRLDEPSSRASAQARYAATYVPGVTGSLRVRVDDPTLPGAPAAVPVDVFAPDDELRRPDTDHPLLEALAAETGGRVLGPDELAELPQLLPNRSVRTISPLTERIWDTPLFFVVFLLLVSAEWIGRKVIRLA